MADAIPLDQPTEQTREIAMSSHHKLTTEKYVKEAQKREAKLLRCEMTQQSQRSFFLLIFALSVFCLAMIAVFLMPSWMPAFSQWLEEVGMLSGQASQFSWSRRTTIVLTRMQAAGYFS